MVFKINCFNLSYLVNTDHIMMIRHDDKNINKVYLKNCKYTLKTTDKLTYVNKYFKKFKLTDFVFLTEQNKNKIIVNKKFVNKMVNRTLHIKDINYNAKILLAHDMEKYFNVN